MNAKPHSPISRAPGHRHGLRLILSPSVLSRAAPEFYNRGLHLECRIRWPKDPADQWEMIVEQMKDPSRHVELADSRWSRRSKTWRIAWIPPGVDDA